jgi:hypothetical protein
MNKHPQQKTYKVKYVMYRGACATIRLRTAESPVRSSNQQPAYCRQQAQPADMRQQTAGRRHKAAGTKHQAADSRYITDALAHSWTPHPRLQPSGPRLGRW